MGDFIMEQEDKNMQAEPSEAQENPKKQPQPKGYEAYLSLFDLVRMLAVITLVFVFFFRLNGVSGSSMYPTLVDKDYLVLESNFLYRDAKQCDKMAGQRLGVDDVLLDGARVGKAHADLRVFKLRP